MWKKILIGMLVAIATGCSRAYVVEPPWPAPTPVASLPPPAPEPYKATSLWTDRSNLARVYDDHRARRVGDLVTVIVVETSEAQREASTGVSRNSSVSAEVTNFLGSGLTTSGAGKFFEPKLAASTGNSFQGAGSTKHKDVLRTRVAARVAHILEDGNLVIEGRRQVQIQQDTQYLYVRGVARTVDISSKNTIESTALADAQILYGGGGLVANQQQPGWMYRVLDKVWPF